MDRLEIFPSLTFIIQLSAFTFQYGQIRNKEEANTVMNAIQIYIPVWIDQKHPYCQTVQDLFQHLHSSMDRLETKQEKTAKYYLSQFTFQYGQIRNAVQRRMNDLSKAFTFQYGQIRNITNIKYNKRPTIIYIPVWIDQKPLETEAVAFITTYLHSSMDRLETT